MGVTDIFAMNYITRFGVVNMLSPGVWGFTLRLIAVVARGFPAFCLEILCDALRIFPALSSGVKILLYGLMV